MSIRIRLAALTVALALPALAGCGGGTQTPAEQPPVTQETPSVTPTASPEPTSPPQASAGAKGEAVPVGPGTITVRDAELGSGGVDVPVKGQSLKIEVAIQNGSSSALTVRRSHWTVESAGKSYQPLETSKPEESGQRTIPAGRTEDVKLIFDVPMDFETGELVFAPAPDQVARVTVP